PSRDGRSLLQGNRGHFRRSDRDRHVSSSAGTQTAAELSDNRLCREFLMNCNDTRKLLNAYVDGELDSTGSLSVESHVQQCGPCRTNLENLSLLSSAVKKG